MSRWPQGSSTIENLLSTRSMERISGSAAHGEPWLEQASRRLTTASHILTDDPESAFVLAYDAARFAGVALLAHQGLRPTQAGGHVAVCDAVRAQFGGPFAQLTTLRRRRNELEYPAYPGEHVEADEVTKAIDIARTLINAAEQLFEHLGLFG